MTYVLCLELRYLVKEHSLICELAEFSDSFKWELKLGKAE